jgi:Outer membrane protein beta-barrel domain
MNPGLRAALAAVLLCVGASELQAADGLYLGAGIGLATVKDQVNTETLDADDTAFRGFIGWRFDDVPLIDLAVEAAYTDFGRPSQTVGGQNVQFKLTGASVAGLLILPLGPLDLYAKGGVLSWRSERSSGASTSSQSGSDPFYGAGIGFYLWKVGIRAEYERFQIKDVDRLQMLSLNVLFQF